MPVYLDYAATAPMRPVAREAWLSSTHGPVNASSLHGSGRKASRILEDAREQVAALAGASPAAVVFTSGATESNAIALRGLFARSDLRRVLVGATEHKSVLDTVAALPGADVTVLEVDPAGRVRLDRIGSDVALVAVMAANNETGTVNDVAVLGRLCSAAGVPWHCDAVQWPATRPLSEVAADTVAVSAHKLGGPVGVGVLIARTDLPVYTHGGGQEGGIRSGTVSVAGASAFAAAWQEADRQRGLEAGRLGELRDRLRHGIVRAVPDAVVNGGSELLASHLNVSFPGCEADALLMLLDAAGVEVSTGAACTLGIPQASHVLLAMGADPAAARGSLRFSLGWATTPADVAAALAAIPSAVASARRAALAVSR